MKKFLSAIMAVATIVTAFAFVGASAVTPTPLHSIDLSSTGGFNSNNANNATMTDITNGIKLSPTSQEDPYYWLVIDTAAGENLFMVMKYKAIGEVQGFAYVEGGPAGIPAPGQEGTFAPAPDFITSGDGAAHMSVVDLSTMFPAAQGKHIGMFRLPVFTEIEIYEMSFFATKADADSYVTGTTPSDPAPVNPSEGDDTPTPNDPASNKTTVTPVLTVALNNTTPNPEDSSFTLHSMTNVTAELLSNGMKFAPTADSNDSFIGLWIGGGAATGSNYSVVLKYKTSGDIIGNPNAFVAGDGFVPGVAGSECLATFLTNDGAEHTAVIDLSASFSVANGKHVDMLRLPVMSGGLEIYDVSVFATKAEADAYANGEATIDNTNPSNPQNPTTGDATFVVIATVAMVSLAGAVIVKKVRV